MNARLYLAIGLTLATAAGSSVAVAQDRLQTILDRGTIIVGTGSTVGPAFQGRHRPRSSATNVDMGHLLAKAIFDDPAKVEYGHPVVRMAYSECVYPQGGHHLPVHDGDAGPAQQVNFTIPYYREGVGLLLMKDGKYKLFADPQGGRRRRYRFGAPERLCRGRWSTRPCPGKAKVDQYESVDLMYQALNSGRADAATDMSSAKWFVAQNPDRYIEGGFGWNPQTYSCAVKKGDQEFLNFVNIAFREFDDRRRFPDLCRLVQEVVRRGTTGAEAARISRANCDRRSAPAARLRRWTTR